MLRQAQHAGLVCLVVGDGGEDVLVLERGVAGENVGLGEAGGEVVEND